MGLRMKTKHLATLALATLVHTASAQPAGGPADPPADKPTEVKWYPGHYLTLASNQPREGWREIADKERFSGGQRIYTWRQLEPTADAYDFTAIAADLAYLRGQNQRLVLEVWDNSFLGEPAPPVPDYLLDAAYSGGIARPAANPKVVRTKRWVPAVMDRYLLLVQALGKRFDLDPQFAGFIHTETAMEMKGQGFEDFSGAAYDAQMRRLVTDSRKAFPNTPVIVFGNWYSYRGSEGLADLARLAQAAGVGWGGPDLCPGSKIWGYDILRSYAGQMPLGLSAQWDSYKGAWTVPQLLDLATQELKLNFVFWGYFNRRKSGGLSFAEDVLPGINAYSGSLVTQRPANLTRSGRDLGEGKQGESMDPKRTTLAAVAEAHGALWSTRIDRHGVILDFVGELPTPEDCALGRPNSIGWWSPIENGPMFTGLYLPAACERARRSGDPSDKAKARRLAQGLLKCASVSAVPGFIARGLGSDGACHYPLGSDDQTHPWFYGLHAYVTSGLPSAEERQQIVAKMTEVAGVLESSGWRCPCDGAFKGQFRGGFSGHLFRDAVRYLFLLRAMYDVTRDPVWLDRYHQALAERPAKSDVTRAEICAVGYGHDREAIKGIDENSLWIYVGSQGSLARLAALETDEVTRTAYRAGLAANLKNCLPAIEAYTGFDNADTKVFGNANWRAVYTTWFPQPTQADAQKLSETGDKEKKGARKHYEAKYMRNPLAAAAIIALAGDGTGREAVERALCHYDYAKLNMSEFFLAECAYYALPEPPPRAALD